VPLPLHTQYSDIMDCMRKAEHLKMVGVRLKIELITSEIMIKRVTFSVTRDKWRVYVYIGYTMPEF
jgi:hypothetical protein